MEKYLKSTAVKVFPSAFRGPSSGSTKYNPEARLNTEFNVTNLTNRLASKDNFVIDWSSGTKIIKFNIHGYYFEANLTEFLGVGGEGASWTNLYASIKIIPFITDEGEAPALNTKYKALTLVGATDSGDSIANPSGRILDVADGGTFIFEGLKLSETPGTPGSNIYELHLLSGGPSAWAVPLTSRLKFVATDVEGLPTINNSTTLKTNNTIFAPTLAGTANQVLISAGGTATPAPVWSGATIGSTTQPIYLNGGVITAITGSIANNTTGTATNVTGTVAIANGGTGATDASTARTNLGLGSMSTQASSNVSITGGSVTGITDITIADGGTGASTAANARSNLGLVIGTNVQAYSANTVVGTTYPGAWNLTDGVVPVFSSSIGWFAGPRTNLNGVTSIGGTPAPGKVLIAADGSQSFWAWDHIGSLSFDNLNTISTSFSSVNGTYYIQEYIVSGQTMNGTIRHINTYSLSNYPLNSSKVSIQGPKKIRVDMPYSTAENITAVRTTNTDISFDTYEFNYTPGVETSAQTPNYTALKNKDGTRGVGAKVTMSPSQVLTFELVLGKSASGTVSVGLTGQGSGWFALFDTLLVLDR
jgi:hypothetical protein